MGRLVNTADINNVLMSEKSNYGVFAVEIDHIISGIVSKCPTIEQKPKTGHWIRISPAGIYECSECGQNVMTSDICAYKFCHGCGSKMVEPQESEG